MRGHPWSPGEGVAWRRAAPGPLLLLPAAVAWLAALIVASVGYGDSACSDQHPCSADWPGSLLVSCWLAMICWLLLTPVVGWLSPLLAVGLLIVPTGPGSLPPSPGMRVAALATAGSAAVLTVALLRHRRIRRGREAAAVDALRLPTGRWNGPVPPTTPGLLAGAGLLVVALGVVLAVDARREGARELRWERSAQRVSGTVVRHPDSEHVTVRWAGGGRTFGVADVTNFPVGATSTVLVGAGRARLAAQPWDPSQGLLDGLLVAFAGGTLAARAASRRYAVAALVSREQPLLDVRAARRGRSVILYPATDTGGRRPLARIRVHPGENPPFGTDGDEPTAPVTVFGRPVLGRPVALVTADGRRLLPAGPVRRGRHRDALWQAPIHLPAERDPERAWTPQPPPFPLPLVIEPPTDDRRRGLLVAVSGVVVAVAILAWPEPLETFRGVLASSVGGRLSAAGLTRAGATLRIDDAGVTVTGVLRRRHVPFCALGAVTADHGMLILARLDGRPPLTVRCQRTGLDRDLRALADAAPAADATITTTWRAGPMAVAAAVLAAAVTLTITFRMLVS